MKRTYIGRARRRQPARAPDANGTTNGSMHPLDLGVDAMPMQDTVYWDFSGVSEPSRTGGKTRMYYISAEKVVWDYAPSGRNGVTGSAVEQTAEKYVVPGPGRVGSRYAKCVYRAYTDDTFRHPVGRDNGEGYLGLLGPVIRAEVGDTIVVVFRNACPFTTSIHPQGRWCDTDLDVADGVPPGGTHTYVWRVPEQAGPAPNDGSSVVWLYHSHTNDVSDTFAGLVGPVEITRRGTARPDGSPSDVDQEVFALFSLMNENASPFLDENVHRFAERPYPKSLADEEFVASNLMHAINGYVFGNQPTIRVRKGERVRWYVMSIGAEVHPHPPCWYGNAVTLDRIRMDLGKAVAARTAVADMVPEHAGVWLFQAHRRDCVDAGMFASYEVLA
ncbi:MAG TPA: multicopper oxidase domain-containing protein [Gaiellaceae bacterium]|nr:multicopper oxidase domain-containing protein [Gaiellaceae bacterium]